MRTNDLRPYVLQLEDEVELAERTLEGLSKSVNQLIKKGEKSQPNFLMKLIEVKTTRGFNGVKKFNHIIDHHVPFLQSKVHYQDCWSLPVVTLTTIAFSLSKVEKNEVDSLLKSVREGLVYVTLVEESLNVTDDYVSIQKEVETLWKEVDFDHKWLGHKLKDHTFDEKTAGQIVEWFRDTAKKIVYQERSKGNSGGQNDDTIHKSSICANSMYRITKTILRTYHVKREDKVSQEELLNNLSSLIADIVAACLTNLPQVITMKCHTSVIEKREASVKDATQLLGETTQLIETLRNHGVPAWILVNCPLSTNGVLIWGIRNSLK